MTHSIADDHANPTQQRTVLLATDNKNSVLAEVVSGKTNHIAYSAYGHQSAKQEVMTRLGFNGELREAQTSWYILGNGYRAYNPRLMRFHSPDDLSPFNKGGLNAYMYCGGEPVINSDPSGRSFFSWENLLKVWKFFSLSNNSSGPRPNTFAVETGSGSGGLWKVAGPTIGSPQAPKTKVGPPGSGGGKGRRHAPPSWKGPQSTAHSTGAGETVTSRTTTSTTQPAEMNPASSRFSSRNNSISSHGSGLSSVSTVSTLSFSSNDSGISSIRSNSRSNTSSGNSDIRRRLETLREQ